MAKKNMFLRWRHAADVGPNPEIEESLDTAVAREIMVRRGFCPVEDRVIEPVDPLAPLEVGKPIGAGHRGGKAPEDPEPVIWPSPYR